MSMTEKLDKLLYSKNITKAQLSKESGIPYTTISGFYTKGTDNVKLSTLRKLADYFQCSLDYLVDDDIDANNIDISDTTLSIDTETLSKKDIEELKECLEMFKTFKDDEKELIYNLIKTLSK